METAAMSIQEQQTDFLSALIVANGSISKACAAVSMERSTFFTWMHDQDFDQRYQDSQEAVIDSYNEELHRSIDNGNSAALFYFMSTVGKDRGYALNETDLYKTLNVDLEERYRGVIEEQSQVIRESTEFIGKLKSRITELEQAQSNVAA